MGETGPPGSVGPVGPPPDDAAIMAAVIAWAQSNPEALAAIVQPHLDPIYFRRADGATGKELSPYEGIHLGEGFTFRVWPEGATRPRVAE